MSKISYCSLDEAWEPSMYMQHVQKAHGSQNPKMQTEEERLDVIQNMNRIERNTRFSNDEEEASAVVREKCDSHKKYLEGKLAFLEGELKKYKDMIEKRKCKEENEIEHFSNSYLKGGDAMDTFQRNGASGDLFDLILLILVGLILIFIMHSIFHIGLFLGERSSSHFRLGMK